MPVYLDAIQKTNKAKKSSQLGIFADDTDDEAVNSQPDVPEVPDFQEHQRLEYEKEVTGLYISGHPYEAHQEKFSRYTNCTISDAAYWKAEEVKLCFGGIISAIHEKPTKKGSIMCNIQVEDTEKSIDVVIFPKMWQNVKGTFLLGDACLIEGKFDDRGQVILEKLILADEIEHKAQRYINVSLNEADINKFDTRKFASIAQSRDYKGNAKIIIEVIGSSKRSYMCLNGFPVSPDKFIEIMPKEFPELILKQVS